MRKFVIILLALIIGVNCFSQTKQPVKQKLNYLGNLVYLDEHPDFHQNRFVLGWHWYSGYKMSSALRVNQIHVFADYDSGGIKYFNPVLKRYADSSNMIINTSYIGHHWHLGGWSISHNIGFQYEPTYKVDLSKPAESFIPRQYDTTRYAFGFGSVKGFIDNTFGNENYDRLQLFNNDSLRNQIVLENPWVCNDLATIIQCDTTLQHNIVRDTIINIYNKPNGTPLTRVDTLPGVEWKGVNFYLNINLRRLNPNDIFINSDTILAIKLPYVMGGTNPVRGVIKFDSIPSWTYLDTFNLPNGRGVVRKMIARQRDTVIYITRNMIPKVNESQRDITISALFVCDFQTLFPFNHNPGLKGFPYKQTNETIDSLKIEVTYKGKCDVGIDWISITTRPTRELAMGFFDNTIKNKIQENLDSMTTPLFTNKGLKPFRWYLVDEPPMRYWFTRSYFTKLLGKIFTFEGGEGMPQYTYYCNNAENWFGEGGILGWRCVPYIPRHKFPPDLLQPFDSLKFWNFDTNCVVCKSYRDSVINISNQRNFGWTGETCYDFNYGVVTDSIRLLRMKNSNYETVNYMPFNYYRNNNISPLTYGEFGHGDMLDIEGGDYNGFYNPLHNQFLFDTVKWWGQIWNDQRMHLDSIKLNSWVGVSGGRILTGEEFRYFMYKIILYGGKGFIMDGEAEYLPFLMNSSEHDMNCLNLHHGQDLVDRKGYNNDPDWIFLNKEDIGGDFLNLIDPNEKVVQFMNMDTISKYLNIDKHRYYVGRKSVRREFKKISEFIRKPSVEPELMSFNLVSAISKGYQRFYIQDKKIVQDSIMKRYLKINNTLTRPLDRMSPYYENECLDEQNQPLDSSFYHLTLLTKPNQNMDTCFYVGLLNKRCGPHILLDSVDVGRKDSIQFFSTAELEDSIAANPTKWTKYYWRRLGTREISLFFNDTTFNYQNKYLRITELGNLTGDSLGYYSWPFWKKDYYDNRIDKFLYPNQPLKVKLLPGSGKILKVQVFDYTTPFCDCDAVMPSDFLTFHRNSNDSCYTFEFELYPCPNINIDSLFLILEDIPECFKKFYYVSFTKDGITYQPFVFDMSSTGNIDTIPLPAIMRQNQGKTKLQFKLCPQGLTGPDPTHYCTEADLMNVKARAYFKEINCEKKLKVGVITSVENFNEELYKFFDTKYNDFVIAPNPATNQINLSFQQSIEHETNLFILDLNGHILQSTNIKQINANEKISLNVSSLSNGSYFIAIYNKDVLLKGKQFVISR